MANFIRSKVHGAQPQAARFYYLFSHMGRYPSSGGYNLDPFQPPLGVPTGVYRIQFLADYTQVEPLPPKITGVPNPTLELHVSDVASPDVSLTSKSKNSELEPRYRDRIFDDNRHLKDRIDYKAAMFADDLTENKMLLGKKFKHISEMAETFVLMRTMRREMLQNIEAMGEASRNSLRLSQEAGEAYVAAKKETPEPPPRQTSPFESLLTSCCRASWMMAMGARWAMGIKKVRQAEQVPNGHRADCAS